MLTNLDFLNIGQRFPPDSEQDRIDTYRRNKLLFENKHAEVYHEQFKRIERVIGNFQNIVSYAVVANFQKLLSLKVADLLLGEPPIITASDSQSDQQKSIDKIIENTDLINTCYSAAIDLSRYGDGLLIVYPTNGNKGMIDVTQPPIWYPVVSPDNIKVITHHVLAWTYCVESTNGKTYYLKTIVHEKGFYTETEYLLENKFNTVSYNGGNNAVYNGVSNDGFHSGQIIKAISKLPERISTGLSNFAVIQIPNVITSDRVTGMDDYEDIDSIVSELIIRIGQMEKVLDQHSAPSVQGPSSSIEKNPATGEYGLKMGGFFARDSNDDPETSYIVWDANMDANFKIIEQLINFLCVISEMGSAIFGNLDKTGGAAVASGTALRFRMINPLAKVKRITMKFKPAIIEAIKLCSELGGEGITNLRKESISVQFQDGLPIDPKEEAEIMDLRSGRKQTSSIKSLLKKFDNLNEQEAQAELDQIEDEQVAATPFTPAPFSGNNQPPNTTTPNNTTVV